MGTQVIVVMRFAFCSSCAFLLRRLGAFLIRVLLDWTRERGEQGTIVRLSTLEGMRARRLYERAGFVLRPEKRQALHGGAAFEVHYELSMSMSWQ